MDKPRFKDVFMPALALASPQPDWPLAALAQATVLRNFAAVLRLRGAVWDGQSVEAVHEIRVNARRARTALQTFGALWPSRDMLLHLGLLERVANAFTVARDTDVLLEYLDAKQAHGAPKWLRERLGERRAAQLPQIRTLLAWLERKQRAQRFADYFACWPLNLWEYERLLGLSALPVAIASGAVADGKEGGDDEG